MAKARALKKDGTPRKSGWSRPDARRHGAIGTPEYKAWQAVKDRCLNPRCKFYNLYGGRGITVYEPWIHDAGAFIAHVGKRPSPKHSLDRIDNERGYEPGNLRWATVTEQMRNRRRTRYTGKLNSLSVRMIHTWLRVGCTMASVGRAFGVRPGTVARIRDGRLWPDVKLAMGTAHV